jgi:hypothetical protein
MTEAAGQAASKDELAGVIAGELGHATNSESIRARLREYLIAAVYPEDLEQQREQFRMIEQTCLKAAKAMWSAPQELDWFPKGIAASSAPALTRDRITALFADDIRKAERAGNRRTTDFLRRRLRKFERSGTLKLEQEKVEPLVQAVIGPSELSLLLNEVSKAAGQAADRLPPKRRARGIPKEDLAAHYSWLLLQEFYRRPASGDESKSRSHRRTAAETKRLSVALRAVHDRFADHLDYVRANWPKLPPVFRAAHNRMLVKRGIQPIPEPVIDLYEPPKKPRFPWSKYLTVTGLFYEYVTGERKEPESFDTACRKVLKETGDRISD